MKFWRRWRLIRWTALAFAAAAVAAPAAQAVRPAMDTGSAAPAQVKQVPSLKDSGWGVDWTEVAIGSSLGVGLLAAGGAVALRRRREALAAG